MDDTKTITELSKSTLTSYMKKTRGAERGAHGSKERRRYHSSDLAQRKVIGFAKVQSTEVERKKKANEDVVSEDDKALKHHMDRLQKNWGPKGSVGSHVRKVRSDLNKWKRDKDKKTRAARSESTDNKPQMPMVKVRKGTQAKPTVPHKDKMKYTRKQKHKSRMEANDPWKGQPTGVKVTMKDKKGKSHSTTFPGTHQAVKGAKKHIKSYTKKGHTVHKKELTYEGVLDELNKKTLKNYKKAAKADQNKSFGSFLPRRLHKRQKGIQMANRRLLAKATNKAATKEEHDWEGTSKRIKKALKGMEKTSQRMKKRRERRKSIERERKERMEQTTVNEISTNKMKDYLYHAKQDFKKSGQRSMRTSHTDVADKYVARQHRRRKGVEMARGKLRKREAEFLKKNPHRRAKTEQYVAEISTNMAQRYRKKAGKDLQKSAEKGDTKRFDKRWKGMMTATKKLNARDVAVPTQYKEETLDEKLKGHVKRNIRAMSSRSDDPKKTAKHLVRVAHQSSSNVEKGKTYKGAHKKPGPHDSTAKRILSKK